MTDLNWRFDHSYAQLPEAFFSRQSPARPSRPKLLMFNHELARELGLDAEGVDPGTIAAQLSGASLPQGAMPIAQAYAGHQFGHFAMLGDGRALLLGEHLGPDGRRTDVQLKGSGQTAFSRRGDGRAALGPMLREYLISEAMHALGIPSTRSLAVVATGDPVYREEVLDGAVLTRVAASHLRVGTFQYASARRDDEALAALVRYALARHDPGVDVDVDERPALALLDAVIGRQVELIVHWMRVGFVHGVMNTDNMTISGETIDYGPCAFVDAYDPRTVFSSIDHSGRYAWGNQPAIAQWNLARLAEALLPIIDPDGDRALELAEAAIGGFADRYERRFAAMMRAKIGLADAPREDDAPLVDALLAWMRESRADYTNTFVALAHTLSRGSASWEGPPASRAWIPIWLERVRQQAGGEAAALAMMSAVNPAYVPRNHLVEAAISAWTERGERDPFQRLLDVVREPYRERGTEWAAFSQPAPPSAVPYQTFCGT